MATVVSPQTDIAWLTERHIVVGSRVGSCTVARLSGTVITVAGLDDLTVKWDNGAVESVRWTAISPFGYVVEVAPLAASASVWASAAAHLHNRVTFIRIDGERIAVVTSSNSGRVYRLPADASRCPCEWNTRTRTMCSHMLCVELAATLDELAARPATAFPPCRVCAFPTDGAGRLCDECCAAQTRRLDLASKRTAVAA